MPGKLKLALAAVAMPTLIGGCSTFSDSRVEWEYVTPETQPVLSAVGYAPISTQPGGTESIKMLMAIKASKLDAYRELAEQVYGHKVRGNQALSNFVVEDVNLRASVDGVIRGAEVVKSYPIGEDVYATELRLDFQNVYDIYLATARPKRVKQGYLSKIF
ncbi:MAG: flagellar biosynthesis protein FlgP [Alteromonadaceae bacterium]|nr:flagellar biosynthesis protein FlgP [Alteromonadaceae bacterium]